MALNESAGILFKIKADSSDAVRELDKVEKEMKGLGASTSSLSSVLGGMVNPAALAAAGVAAIATAAVAATKALFDLAQGASEYGSMIFDASQKTGLGAETLSALKFAADQAGSSFEQVTKGIQVFGVEVGKAAQGNQQAVEKMKALGVTSNDLDEALKQVFTTINNGKTDTDKLALASEAFGKKIGPDLIPLIKDANGNLDEMVDKAKELGVTITDDAMRAADEFGDQMGLLNTQLQHVAYTIGFAVIPVFNEMAGDFSEWLVRNKSEIADWAKTVGIAFRQAIAAVKPLVLLVAAASTGDYTQFVLAASAAIANEIQAQSTIGAGVGGRLSGVGSRGGFSGAGKGSGKSDADRRAKDDLAAEIEIQKNVLKEAEDTYEAALKKLRDVFKETGDSKAFIDGATAALTKFTDAAGQTLAKLTELENKQAEGGTENQLELLRQKQEQRVKALQEDLNAGVDANNKIVADKAEQQQEVILDLHEKTEEEIAKIQARRTQRTVDELKKETDAEIKSLTARLKAGEDVGDELGQKIVDASANFRIMYEADLQARLDALDREKEIRAQEIRDKVTDKRQEQELIAELEEEFHQRRLDAEDEFRQQIKQIADEYPIPAIVPEDDWITKWQDFFAQVAPGIQNMAQATIAATDLMTNAFQGIANAIGSVVEQWVLYGNTAPAIMRKILASALASIAAEAAVRAIYELAAGFASLFFNPGEAAAHFTAAALFGSIAVGAALAGRAIAGDAFKKQTSSATGGASGQSASQQDTSSQGQQFSGNNKTQVVDINANQPAKTTGVPVTVTLRIADDSTWLGKMLKADVETNGGARQQIKLIAQDA